MPTDAARNAADIAADALRRLREDLEAAAMPEGFRAPADVIARTLADDRNEAAGALERASKAMPQGRLSNEAQDQANALRGMAGSYPEAAEVRGWEAAWRAFSVA